MTLTPITTDHIEGHPVELTASHLVLPPNLTWDEWVGVGRPIMTAAAGSRWWLGDWLIYAERHLAKVDTPDYDPKVKGAILQTVTEELGIALSTITDAKRVSRRFPPPLRNGGASWSHHRVVVGVDDELAQGLLTSVAEYDWSVEQLKAEVRRLQAIPVDGKEKPIPAPQRLRFKRPLVIEDPAKRARVVAGFQRVLAAEGLEGDLLEVA